MVSNCLKKYFSKIDTFSSLSSFIDATEVNLSFFGISRITVKDRCGYITIDDLVIKVIKLINTHQELTQKEVREAKYISSVIDRYYYKMDEESGVINYININNPRKRNLITRILYVFMVTIGKTKIYWEANHRKFFDNWVAEDYPEKRKNIWYNFTIS